MPHIFKVDIFSKSQFVQKNIIDISRLNYLNEINKTHLICSDYEFSFFIPLYIFED